MSPILEREKQLPEIPIDTNASQAVAKDEGLGPTLPANANKPLPPIKIESVLSKEEMGRLHELWNGAASSVHANRRRRRNPDLALRQIPSGSTSKPEKASPTSLGRADESSIISTPSPETGTRKRWGFLIARPCSETQDEEKKAPSALEILREMAQVQLKRKLKYVKSAPDLGNHGALPRQEIKPRYPIPMPVKVTPQITGASSTRNAAPPRRLEIPKAVIQQEDKDENAIYFKIDPSWRASQESVQFEPITRIPDSPVCLVRPDSPLLHRHNSLDQLEVTEQKPAMTGAATDFPKAYARSAVVHPIDRLHAYLGL